MLENENIGGLVDSHRECDECKVCRKMHPLTSAACPGQTGTYSTFLCEKIRAVNKEAKQKELNTNIGKKNHVLMDANTECAECRACRYLHPETSKYCPGQTGHFSDFTCETLRKKIAGQNKKTVH